MSKILKKKDAYFLAKRQMVEVIDRRISKLKKDYQEVLNSPPSPDRLPKSLDLQVRMDELEKMRNYIRNVLLWDTRHDLKKS